MLYQTSLPHFVFFFGYQFAASSCVQSPPFSFYTSFLFFFFFSESQFGISDVPSHWCLRMIFIFIKWRKRGNNTFSSQVSGSSNSNARSLPSGVCVRKSWVNTRRTQLLYIKPELRRGSGGGRVQQTLDCAAWEGGLILSHSQQRASMCDVEHEDNWTLQAVIMTDTFS